MLIYQGPGPFYEQANSMYPGYESFLDPSTGKLQSQYQLQYTPIQGGNAWERNMLGKQAIESQRARDLGNAANNSAWASARSGMAMRGGLSSGAGERLAGQQANAAMMNAQNQNQLDMQARLGIGAEGEKQRIDMDKYNSEMGLKVNQWNNEQALNENRYKNMAELEKYKSYMQGKAAERQAVATENSGKK